MKKINLPQKGEPDYLIRQKKLSTIKTAISFAAAIIIFIIGYAIYHTRENIFTIIAVLALLPASRNTVSMIMFLKTPAYDTRLCNQIQQIAEIPMLYHLYLTSYQKNYAMTCMTARGANLIGFSEFDKCDVNSCKEHIEGILTQNGIKNINVKIFGKNDYKMFEERLKQLQAQEAGKHDEELLSLMCDISL